MRLRRESPLDGGLLTHDDRLAAKQNETRSIAHFRAWVRHARRAHPPGSADSWRFTTVDGHGNEQSRRFNATQLSWLVDEQGALLVKEIYKLEELEDRWPELKARVCGLRRVAYRAARDDPAVRAMDHPSRHAPYAQYYDEETIGIVAEYMAADIQRFGYRPPDLSWRDLVLQRDRYGYLPLS